MFNYSTLLRNEAEARGWTPEQISTFEQWRNGVGQVESNNIPTRTQGDSSSGIARGKYQYETSKGSGANKSAVIRYKQYLQNQGYSFDDLSATDRAELNKKDPDFSKLSEDVQDQIFLADKAIDKGTKLDSLVKGDISPVDAWISWHWRGDKEKAESKRQQWERNTTPTVSDVNEGVNTDYIAPSLSKEMYKVKGGDTLTKIASDKGLTLEQIQRMNPSVTNPNNIKVDQELVTKENVGAPPSAWHTLENPLLSQQESAYDRIKKALGL